MKNEIKIVHTISKDLNMNFGLEKCARICLKRGIVQSKMHIGNTVENDIKELEPSVEPEMYDHTSNNWSHWDSNEKL